MQEEHGFGLDSRSLVAELFVSFSAAFSTFAENGRVSHGDGTGTSRIGVLKGIPELGRDIVVVDTVVNHTLELLPSSSV